MLESIRGRDEHASNRSRRGALETRNGRAKMCKPIVLRDIINASRAKTAKLHRCFEWDDSIAGELFREEQARRLLTCYEVTITDDAGEERTISPYWVPMGEPGQPSDCYLQIDEAMADPEIRESVLANCLAQLASWVQDNR